jgi:peptidoglycan hydrolase-like protein with peptidoglycan-binding domain
MRRSLTAVLALAAAAGFAGWAQAQSTTTTTTPSSTAPSAQTTAPSYQYQPNTPPTNSSATSANPSMMSGAAPQASTQTPTSGNSFWSQNISENAVRQAQQQLQSEGLYRGPIDGKVGSQMERALAQYQRRSGLRQTGTLDEQTMSRLASGAPGMATGPAVGSTTPPTATTPRAPATSNTAAPLGAGGSASTSSTAPTAPGSNGTPPTTR